MTDTLEVDKDSEEPVVSLESAPKYLVEAFLLAGKGEFDHSNPGLRERCFVTSEASLFGCLIEEVFDSFLVALPSVIRINEAGKASGRLVPECRVVRLLKSQVISCTIPNPQQQYFYMNHLKTLYEFMPDFFHEGRKEYIEYKTREFEKDSPEKTHFNFRSESDGEDEEDVAPRLNWDMPDNAGAKSFQYLYAGTNKQ